MIVTGTAGIVISTADPKMGLSPGMHEPRPATTVSVLSTVPGRFSRSGGWGLPGSFAVRASSGGEDDVVAEGVELGKVIPGLTVSLVTLVAVVGAEVLVARAWAGQELVVDLQLRVGDGDLGFVFADAAG